MSTKNIGHLVRGRSRINYFCRLKNRPKEPDKKDTDNVKVVVRCRPLNDKEKGDGHKQVVKIDEVRGSVIVSNPNASKGEEPKTFTFDHVFGPDSKQSSLYLQVAKPIVDFVLEGYNGTIFAYGQTGTGKTYTMEGIRAIPEGRGIIPNSFASIFNAIHEAKQNIKFLVHVSYLEIYNEEVRDLLGQNQKARLEVKERPDIGVYVKDLSKYPVHVADDMDRIMTKGNKNRSVGATDMNADSSRSHAIFTVTVEQADKGPDGKERVRSGKLHLVDLAGSERQSKTHAVGQRLKEATKINLSLSTLGNVISALVDGKSQHIPYRNSKLTRLLQDSLGGNSKTLMVANTGPAGYNYEETISTLRYANRAKNIKNKARINEDPKDALLRQMQIEMERLRKQLEDEGPYSEESGSEEDDDGEDGDEEGGKRKKKKKRKGLSKEEMARIQSQIDDDRKKLESEKGMEEKEKMKIEQDLQDKEEELAKAQDDQQRLQTKLDSLNKKIIVGGENLLDKAQEQQRLLEESQKELDDRNSQLEKLREKLEKKGAERVDIEEKYNTLQEEITGKTKKLKRVWTMYSQAKTEIADLQQEHQREMEGLLENVRQLSRELRLQMLLIDNFIPPEYQEMLEHYVHWNEDIGEWQLKCVAYTGNNMRKQTPLPDKNKDVFQETDLSSVYLSYTAEGLEDPVKPKSSRGKSRTKSAKPKSNRKK